MNMLILWSLDTEETIPVGALKDKGDHVLVVLPEEYGGTIRWVATEDRLQEDMTRKEWNPGDEGYLERVAENFHWSFAITRA